MCDRNHGWKPLPCCTAVLVYLTMLLFFASSAMCSSICSWLYSRVGSLLLSGCSTMHESGQGKKGGRRGLLPSYDGQVRLEITWTQSAQGLRN